MPSGKPILPRSDKQYGTKKSPAVCEKILEGLRKGLTVTEAAFAVNVSRNTVMKWKRQDPEFKQAYYDAMDEGTDIYEKEARRRAIEGYKNPVFYQGEQVGEVTQYSDRLLELFLRGRRPEVFNDRVEVSGRIEHDVRQVTVNMSAQEAADAYAASLRRVEDRRER